MKLLAALSFLLPYAYAQEAPAPAVQPDGTEQRVSAQEEAKPYLEFMHKQLDILQGVADCLASVKDKASADAAAPKVKELVRQARSLQKDTTLSGAGPSKEAQEIVAAQSRDIDWKGACNQALGKALQLWSALPPCYGSKQLQAELDQLLGIYLGK